MQGITIKSTLVGLILLLGACSHYHHFSGWDHDNRDNNKAQKHYNHDNKYKKNKDKHDD